MIVAGSLAGPVITRKFSIGATVVEGQVVCRINQAGAAQTAMVGAPAGVEDCTEAVGVTFEAGTYAATSPGVFVKCSCSPFQIIRGRASGGVAADTAHTAATLLTLDAAHVTLFADAEVADLDYEGGLLVLLTGAYAGHVRTITTQTDVTDTRVTVPWPAALAVGTKALRTYNFGIYGIELTTNFVQFNNLLGAGEALEDAQGEFFCYDVFVDGQSITQVSSGIVIQTPTNPMLEFEAVFADHAFNSLA